MYTLLPSVGFPRSAAVDVGQALTIHRLPSVGLWLALLYLIFKDHKRRPKLTESLRDQKTKRRNAKDLGNDNPHGRATDTIEQRIWNSPLHHSSSVSNARGEENRESKTNSSRSRTAPAAKRCMSWSKGFFSITSATLCSKRSKTRR